MLRKAFRINGFIALAVILVLIIGSIAVAIAAMFAVADSGDTGPVVVVVLAGFVLFIALMAMTGLTVVDPNEARVVQFFGRYIGSVIVNDGNRRYYEPGRGRGWTLGLEWQWSPH